MPNYTAPENTIQPLARWLYRYNRLGFPAIPLEGKAPPSCVTSWQHVPPGDQWRLAAEAAGGQWRGNIGLLAGNGYGFIDCDGPETTARVNALLAELAGPTHDGRRGKYAPYASPRAPRVTTPHDGQHVYLRVSDVPPGFNWATLPPELGTGELRLRNCYVVAPSSRIDGKAYRFQHGRQLEALTDMPPVAFRDLERLGLLRETTPGGGEAVAVPLLRRDLPNYAYWLLSVLGVAGKGQPLRHYASRSEAEAAVIALAILAGWPVEHVAELFGQYRPGHYAGKSPRQREAYVALTYSRVLAALATTPERSHLGQLYRQAEAAAWPGRGGATDKRIYTAMLGLAWPSGATLLAAASRDLAMLAAVDDSTARKATRRLHTGGSVAYVGKSFDSDGWRPDRANRYRITGLTPPAGDRDGQPPETAPTVTVGGLEVWAAGRLGGSCELVYSHLPLAATATVAGLAEATGKHRNTVAKALAQLAHYGLAEGRGAGKWRKWGRGAATLAAVARQLEAERGQRSRRRKVEAEREAYQTIAQRKRGAA